MNLTVWQRRRAAPLPSWPNTRSTDTTISVSLGNATRSPQKRQTLGSKGTYWSASEHLSLPPPSHWACLGNTQPQVLAAEKVPAGHETSSGLSLFLCSMALGKSDPSWSFAFFTYQTGVLIGPNLWGLGKVQNRAHNNS